MNRNPILLLLASVFAHLGSTPLWSQDFWKRSYSTNFSSLPPQDIDLHERVIVEWDTPEIHPLGEIITIKGKVYDHDRFSEAASIPIPWNLGITAGFLRKTDTPIQPDQQFSRDRFIFSSFVLNLSREKAVSSNEFSFSFLRSLLPGKGNESETIAVAISLADQNNHEKSITFSSEDRILAQSISMIELPPMVSRNQAMSLVCKATAQKEQRSDYNPLQILRATNALQSLGKEDALRTLENVIQLQEQYPYLFDDSQFFWILAMLFEPIRFGGEIREPFIPFDFVRLREEWPTNPIEVVEGIPILITSGSDRGFAGKKTNRANYLDHFQRDCVLRDAPLIPTMDPVLAIDIFEKSQKVAISSSKLSNVQDSLRAQAVSTLPEDHPLRAGYLSEQVSWSELVEFSRKSPVVWDRETETFQLRKTDNPR